MTSFCFRHSKFEAEHFQTGDLSRNFLFLPVGFAFLGAFPEF